jgi:ankyrin repeat protein
MATYWVVPKSVWLLFAWLLMAAPVVATLAAVGLGLFFFTRAFPITLNKIDAFTAWWRRESLSCPNAGCYEAIDLPIFVCPGCGERHAALLPSERGVWSHTCRCGKRLPTGGAARAALPALCPHCQKPLSVVRVHTTRFALVAGPSAGKTSYLVGLMKELHQQSELGRIGLTFADERSERRFKEGLEQLATGVQPHKTPETSPDAFIGQLRDLVGNSVVFHVYDAAGELWQQTDLLRDQAYLDKCSGLILILDPFTLPQVLASHASTLEPIKEQVNPSEESPQQAYDRLVVVLRERLNQTSGTLSCPLAVVITKADALGLIEEIDGGRARTGTDWQPLPHAQVRAWLERNGGGNLIRSIEADFSHVGFFACSALGRLPDASGTPYVPRAVLHPMAWLLAHAGIQLEQAGEIASTVGRARLRVRAARAAVVVGLVAFCYAFDAAIFHAAAPPTLRGLATMGIEGVARQLLAAGASPDAADEEGRTPLMLAATHGSVGVAQALLERGANVEAKSRTDERPLLAATERHARGTTTLLLKHHAQVNVRSQAGSTPIFNAVRHGDAELAAELLAAGADPNTLSPVKVSVLVEAYGRNDLATMKALLAKGADPDARNAKGIRLLHVAIGERNVPRAEVLLGAGANVSEPDAAGLSPLVRAIDNQDDEMLAVLIRHKAPLRESDPNGDALVYRAIRTDAPAIVRRLLSSGAPVPARGQGGRTLVSNVLAMDDHTEMLEAVLRGGASPRIANSDGDYPVHEAASTGKLESLKLLLSLGASPHDVDSKGRDLGLLAADRQDHDLLEMVLPVASVRARTPEGDTLLTKLLGDSSAQEASGFDYKRSVWVRDLIRRGASPNAANARGNTPLHVAIRKGFSLTAAELLNAGADFERANQDGETPEGLASGDVATQIAQIKERREAARRAAEEARARAEEARKQAREARERALEAERVRREEARATEQARREAARAADRARLEAELRRARPAGPVSDPTPAPRYGAIREVSGRQEIWDGEKWCPTE